MQSLFGRKVSIVYRPVIREIEQWVRSNDERMARFDEAIKTATSHELKELADIQSFSDWLHYINDTLVWVPNEAVQAKEIFDRFCRFYFILDQPSVIDYQSPIVPSSFSAPKTVSWLSAWIVRYGQDIGKFMDTPESLTPASLQTFKDRPAFHFNDYLEPRGGWRNFNEFFARQFKPGYRPISGLEDTSVITSPADCVYNGKLEISPAATLTLKTLTWRISELLADSAYAERFAHGTWIHGYLGTNDYHRVHAPVGGKVVEAKNILGQHYVQLVVQEVSNTDHEPLEQTQQVLQKATKSLYKHHEFDAPNDVGYQFVQSRGLVLLDTPFGMIAVLLVGMGVVSSVMLTAEVGVTLRKGEEMGYFQFGGSDVVVLFDGKRQVNVTAAVEQHCRMGTELGRWL